MRNKVVVPFSGGMDSTTLLYHAKNMGDEVHAVSFNYGQKHKKELEAAQRTINKIKPASYRVIDISFFKDVIPTSSLTNSDIDVAKAKDVMGDPQTVNYVPFRNMMLLSIACAYAEAVGANTVFHGAAQADSVAGYWDGSPEFLVAINNVTGLNRRNRINIKAPLIDMSKAVIIKFGGEMRVPYEDTWTCYEGDEKACGECTACALRLKGFIDAKIKDPIEYKKDINWAKYTN